MSQKSMIRIANAGGYWGDDPFALRRQVYGALKLDYISIDFLAEITMSILQKQKAKDPSAGFARDFVTQLEPLIEKCVKDKIKIITNAGGVNPEACAQALFELAKSKNISLKIAIVDGDNIISSMTSLTGKTSFKNMETGEGFAGVKDRVLSANVYFGAMPVAKALAQNPDIVICGRVTDTGITLAAMMHEFGWSLSDYDKLASGIVAGHMIECGAQATGGNFTDWKKVKSFVDVGYPIIECFPDGSFVLTKHPDTGGLVSCQTAREQLLYEMGHPQSYITPDVIADFATIQMRADGPDRVHISGVQGRKPTDLLKVSIAYADGFKSSGTLIISGPDARAKSETFAGIFWTRLTAELKLAGFADVEFFNTEHIGDDSTHRALTPATPAHEILLRLSVRDNSKEKIAIFRKLLPSLILSGPAGVAVTGGAPAISDVVSYWPALIPQELALANVRVSSGGSTPSEVFFKVENINWPQTGGTADVSQQPADSFVVPAYSGAEAEKRKVSLAHLAHARSGDKGDTANIGLIARSPECYAWIRDHVTAAVVQKWFASLAQGQVTRHAVPNLWSLNFLLEESLGGGGTMSLFIDAQGKTLSQALLRCEVEIPAGLLKTILAENASCDGELTPSKAL